MRCARTRGRWLACMLCMLMAACERGPAQLDREFLVFGSSAELTLRNAPPPALARAADQAAALLAAAAAHLWRDAGPRGKLR